LDWESQHNSNKNIMKNTIDTIKSYAGGVTSVLLSVIGLLVVAQVVFGEGAPINVIGNLQDVVTGFVGQGASLAGVITLLLLIALLKPSSEKG
jgi:hypothetical protein